MSYEARLSGLIIRDAVRWDALGRVRALGLPDSWIAAGFIRDAVWDHLHGRSFGRPEGDVDVIWFDPVAADESADRELERRLKTVSPEHSWSVKNQARMHLRNADPPYRSSGDAMQWWPETATAVGVRRRADDRLEIMAPFGLDDLFRLRLVPTPAFTRHKRAMFEDRLASKQWLARYPHLQRATP